MPGTSRIIKGTFALTALGCLAVSAQSLPNINVAQASNQTVVVSWAVPTVSYVLQEAATLTTPAAWQTSTLVPASNKCVCSVTIPATNSARFFRLAGAVPSSIGLYLGAAQPLFQVDAMNMTDVPDMHTAIMQQTNGSYKLWIAGRFENDAVEGATGLLLTTNFLAYTPGHGPATNAEPVLVPSCRGATMSSNCWDNFDAGYAGANLVFTATNGTDLLMLYDAETKNFGAGPPNALYPSWGVIGMARSSDQGITWTDAVAVVSGSDPKPATNPPPTVFGVLEPGAIIASNYIYAFYTFFPTPGSTNAGPVIQVARSALTNDGAAGTWTKFYNGSFGSQPGLLAPAPGSQSLGSQIVPTVCGCTRPSQPWPVFSTCLNAYVLVFEASEGWFFSTSTNLINWASPTQFFTAPAPEFTTGEPTDENFILLTPGKTNQVIGQTGLVLYAHTPAWKEVSHELWIRPFTFTKSP